LNFVSRRRRRTITLNADAAAPASSEAEHEIKDVNKLVGKAIREVRNRRGLSLRELSELSGFSISFLSLVERGKSSLALTSLQKVANALGTDVPSLFPSEFAQEHSGPLPYVQRASDTNELTIENSERTYRLLSGRAPDRVLEPILETVPPTGSVVDPYGHHGEEFVYVLEGTLTCIVDGVEYELTPGDSIHYPALLPHATVNRGSETARALFVCTPRFF
jgi:transcriptional regulator with XRE-family HTH domain